MTDLPDALARFEELERRLGGKTPALFLDYDGTLTPIVARPELAVLDDDMRSSLRKLSQLLPVAIISGRDRPDVERLVGLPELVYAGSHGFDIAGPGGLKREYEDAEAFAPALREVELRLRAALGGIEGVLIEPKRYAVAVHYRLVDDKDVGAVEEAFDAVLSEAGSLRRTEGKKVFELRPSLDWDKGKAVLWLLTELGLDDPGIMPLYIGDDDTDEDAFAALALRGIAILVANRNRTTRARYRLDSPRAVGEFLRRLIASRSPNAHHA